MDSLQVFDLQVFDLQVFDLRFPASGPAGFTIAG
jgi:hypothetical protein